MNILGIKIDNLNFKPFDQFELNWRFTDPNYNLLSKSDLSKIKPVDKEVTERVSLAIPNFVHNSRLLNSNESLSLTEDLARTKNWLSEKGINQIVFVYWCFQKEMVKTPFEIFIKYWDDFCYPSSDDVLIIPEKMNFLLLYCHDEIFEITTKIGV